MMMADENCKAIERHIKDLLFKKESFLCGNSQKVAEYLEKKSPDAPLSGNHQPQNKGNYRAFNHAVSPRKMYKVNTAFQNRPPVLHQEGVPSNHTSGNVDQSSYQNVGNPFSSQSYSQTPPSSYVHHQMRDVRFLNTRQNNEQISGGSHGFASASNLKPSLNSHVHREAIPDKAPGAFDKSHAERVRQGDHGQTSPQQAGNKSEFQKDAKNKRKKKKDKKKKMKHSPDGSVVSENISSILDLLTDSAVENNSSLSPEKFTPLQQKGDSSAETPLKTSKFLKQVNKPFFSEDKETIILRSEFQGQLYFSCYICDYGSSDSSGISRHISSSNHKAQLKAKEMRHLLLHLPEPLPKQVESVTKCIVHVANKYGLSEDDLNLRKIVVDRVKEKIESHIPGCHLEPIGSSITGFGLKVSHIDIVLKVPKEKNAADILFTTFELLKEDKSFKEVHNEFRKKIPQIEFVDVASDLTCNICIDNGTVSEFTKLLCDYAKLDPRVRVLGIAFRYWAKMCE